jgi:hypothetical protein
MYLYAIATAQVADGVGLKSLILSHRERGAFDYVTTNMASGMATIVSGLIATRTYEAVLTVTDNLSNSYSQSYIFAHKQRTLQFKIGGKAGGVGAAAGEDGTLRLGWKVIFEEGLESFVPLLPIGACVMLDSNLDPVEEMGGEWTEIDWSSAPAGVKLWKRTK